ncbi:MAG TPA: RidA family protein [Phototrophicaceae bacterium]|nr:RidA family protein [Phototrophicaceae bacterium]
MKIETKLTEMGLVLPEPLKVPPGSRITFAWARVYGQHVYVSGHGPQQPDGSMGPFGKVGAELSPEQAYQAARSATLSILSSLKRSLGDLDRVEAWLNVSGMINVAPGFVQTTQVMNGFSDLVIDLYGSDVGIHARTAIGVAALPFGLPVVIAAEVAISP